MCPGRDIAVAVHEMRAGHPPLLELVKDATRAAALAKHYADEAALFVADRAVQVLGGHGYIREHPVERWLREARGFAATLGLAMI